MKGPPDRVISSAFYGRILREDKAKKQLLRSHLRNVAERTLESAKEAQPVRADEGQETKRWKENFHNTARLLVYCTT